MMVLGLLRGLVGNDGLTSEVQVVALKRSGADPDILLVEC